jgi:hypothetical protein
MTPQERLALLREVGLAPEDVDKLLAIAEAVPERIASVQAVTAERDRLRTQRDALLALLEQCDVFLRIHATPGNELKADVQAAIRAAKETK